MGADQTTVERHVLGAMILWGEENVGLVRTILSPGDFTNPVHRGLAGLLYEMQAKSEPIDISTVNARMQEIGFKTPDPISIWVAQLLTEACYTQTLEYFSKKIRETARRRAAAEAILAAHRGVDAGDDSGSILISLQDAQRAIEPEASGGWGLLSDLLLAESDAQQNILYEKERAITGVPTGITMLDLMTMGMQAQEMTVLAARPSQGKTALAIQIALHAAKSGRSVAFASLEMSSQAILHRMVSHRARVDSMVMRRGGLEEQLIARIVLAKGSLAKMPLWVMDTSGLTPAMLSGFLRKIPAVDLLVVDYLQLMVDDERHSNRNEEVGALSRKMKAIAKESNIPVLVLAQLKRPRQGSEGQRPYLSDLRESGAIEADADVVLFIHGDAHKDREQVEIIIEKSRNGPVGTISSTFRREIGEFS